VTAPSRRASLIVVAVLLVLVGWAVFSYSTAGLIYFLVSGSSDQGAWLDRLRQAVASWGRLAPIVYTLIVIVEVVVAPIPGALLYAPGGAIFGGFLGGTLSLVGNTIGAAISCLLGGAIGERLFGGSSAGEIGRYRERLQQRGLWVVLLLRANPLTSSDLVSYAAGIAGVPPWKVAAGTFIGMAPLCYLQAYFAARIFELIPGRIVAVGGIVIVIALVAMIFAGRNRRTGEPVSRAAPH
jgi:uncharacterized membrane protein YdjX (TVP38/TMEM64 family)